jgi:PhzF family phenazine biosynthesis protein
VVNAYLQTRRFEVRYFVVDTFTKDVFSGNSAGVCLVDETIDSKTMQNIAFENNLAETAFIRKDGDDFDLRWFTPETEIDLCGHATLASAFVISQFIDSSIEIMKFHTLSGILPVVKKGDLFEMDFPSRKPTQKTVTPSMEQALGVPVLEAHLARDMLLLVENEKIVTTIHPNLECISQIPDAFGVIVTAKGNEVDFVSRFFAPNAGIPEDPVTGSSHSTLIPFWAERLHKTKMVAKQLSKRGGTLYCEHCGERVKISGYAVLYLSGEIHV